MPPVRPYLMEQAGDHLDYISVHNYWLPRANALPEFDYLTAVMRSEMPDAYMTIVTDSLRTAGMERLRIAFDEWNLRAWQHPGFPRDKVENYDDPGVRELVDRRRRQNDQADQYTMADALFAASFLNACLRHSEQVAMANIAPLVNTHGPLFVHSKGIVKRTHFHSMWMYANLLQKRVGNVRVTAGTIAAGKTSVAAVDAIATVDESGKQWSVALINRHPSQSVACTLKMKETPLDGTYKATLLTGDSPDSYNDIEHPDRVAPKEVELAFKEGIANLPPHSLVIVDVPVEK